MLQLLPISQRETVCPKLAGQGLLGATVKFSLVFLLTGKVCLFVFPLVPPVMPVTEEMSGHLGKRMPS